MIKKIIDGVLSEYASSTYIIKKKVYVLFWCCLVGGLFVIIASIINLSTKTSQTPVISSVINLMMIIPIILTLIFLRKGKFSISVNILITSLTLFVVAGSLAKYDVFFKTGSNGFLLFSSFVIVAAALFNSRRVLTVIFMTFLSLNTFFFIMINITSPSNYVDLISITLNFYYSMIGVFVISYLIYIITGNALENAEGELDKNISFLREKEILLSEIHHRVKNNMQIVSSLLSLQSKYVRDEEDRELFNVSKNRVHAMAMVHEKLYQSGDLASINFPKYIKGLSNELYHSYNTNPAQIKINIVAEEISIDINNAIPCALIVNELVSNSLKHAFPEDRQGEITVCFEKNGNGTCSLSVSDNGVGLPEGLDYKVSDSLGLRLVNGLTAQLKGELKVEKLVGAKFIVIFPV